MSQTIEELHRLYGEAAFEAEVWLARANDYKRQLIERHNQAKNDSSHSLNGTQKTKE